MSDRAMYIRQEEALKLRATDEIDGYDALILTLFPSQELREWSEDQARLELTPTGLKPGAKCRKGHLRTEENTFLRFDKRRGRAYLFCRACSSQWDREYKRECRKKDPERRRQKDREQYERIMADPERRARKNARNAAYFARKKVVALEP